MSPPTVGYHPTDSGGAVSGAGTGSTSGLIQGRFLIQSKEASCLWFDNSNMYAGTANGGTLSRNNARPSRERLREIGGCPHTR
jgi:hypothetical protein